VSCDIGRCGMPATGDARAAAQDVLGAGLAGLARSRVAEFAGLPAWRLARHSVSIGAHRRIERRWTVQQFSFDLWPRRGRLFVKSGLGDERPTIKFDRRVPAPLRPSFRRCTNCTNCAKSSDSINHPPSVGRSGQVLPDHKTSGPASASLRQPFRVKQWRH
jgi:hypothetical protein